jgi:uncharacterized membrane protein YfcA
MWVLLAFLTAGALAQLIDGALGMGFGVTSSSFLLTLGLAPAAASASVHAAEVITSLASGASHLRLGNVDKQTLPWLVVPGCIGGAAGAVALTLVVADWSRPTVAAFLLVMGLLIVARALRGRLAVRAPLSKRRTGVLGFLAAGLDAFGGGGWGPIATPSLILSASHEPRKAVGTVSLAEFFVSVSITATFLVLLGMQVVRWDFVAAAAAGGVLVAPFAARLARRVRAQALAEAVGAMLVIINARALAVSLLGVDATASAAATLAAVAAVIVWLASRGMRPSRDPPREPPAEAPAPAAPPT